MGEVALLASTSMDNLINLGLLDPPTDRYKLTVNRLMSFALQIFPLSFFAYAVEMWMFDFFKGEKSDDAHLNEHWWYLVNKIQVCKHSQIYLHHSAFYCLDFMWA